MTTIFELANAFLSIEQMTNKKLPKLCYYAKAWHLALYAENLINEPFEAWVHGPVRPLLYDKYKDCGSDSIIENVDSINDSCEFFPFVQQIYDAYGHLDGDDLELVTHKEFPWIEARGGKHPCEFCNTVISESTMKSYYTNEYSKAYA